MLRLALGLALAGLLLSPPTARADACDGLVAQIAQATGAKKVGKRIGPSTEVRTAAGTKLDVTCRGADPIVQAASSEARPSGSYFGDLSTASQYIVGESADAVQAALVRAYEAAVQQGRKSFIQQRGWSASCYADPGGGSLRTLCSVGRIPPG